METEHKYLIAHDGWRELVAGQQPVQIDQYYMPNSAIGAFGYGRFSDSMFEDIHAIAFDNEAQYRILMRLDAKAVRQYDALGEQGRAALFGERGRVTLSERCEARVRVEDGMRAFLTLKAKGPRPEQRYELELPISMDDARFLIAYAEPPVHKQRYTIPMQPPLKWEIDVYQGANAGLTVAEIELPNPATPYLKPAWLGANVTGDARYSNRSLAHRPYGQWGEHEKKLRRADAGQAQGLA